MPAHESPDWLVRIYEEQGSSLHRLVVLLGAEAQSGRIVRSALLALHRRGHRMIDRLATGMMGLNTGLVSNAAAPFGGVKQSGIGREGGAEGIHEYLDTKYTLIPIA